MIAQDGFAVFEAEAGVAAWATAARGWADAALADADQRARHLRHGQTWFVGVDALPNDAEGRLAGVSLPGAWRAHVPDLPLHRAQVSMVLPGYPRQDPDQSDANHRYRVMRAAAHVDGLLPEGPDRRRFAREHHAYILGLPLSAVAAAPTVVWRGSHRIMQAALRAAIGAQPVGAVDVTAAYHAARRQVFDTCACVPVIAEPGQSFLIHRFALHGMAPWSGPAETPRMVAFFRPAFADPALWLAEDA